MNFLAHIYLSGDQPQVMIGNFIGDFVKGRNLAEQFSESIAKGIELHRAIDAYTDQHAVVRESKMRLRPKYRHYAAVIVDVFYDHFLSRYWSNYHPMPILDFSQQTYQHLLNNLHILPAGVQYMLPHMMRDNWLVNYGKLDGIGRALSGMASRSRYDSKMNEAVLDLQEHYPSFKDEFERFFPDLTKHAADFLKQHH